MARYLITGIAGFIGSSLAYALVEQGHEVCGIDNLSTGNLDNLAGIRHAITFQEMDLQDVAGVKAACQGVDYVLHQGALASVPRSVKDPLTSHESNINGTLNLLIAARDAKVRRIVYAASSSAYGDQPTQPKQEDMLPRPLSPYAVQKLTCEYYIQSFYRAYGLEGVCLRYFNIFGPRQAADSPYSGVIAQFTFKMMAGETPTIFGDGLTSRDFNYIDNAVSANLLACSCSQRGRYRSRLQHWHRKEPHPERGLRRDRRPARLHRQTKLWPTQRRRHQTLSGRHHARQHGTRLPAQGPFSRRAQENSRVVSGREGKKRDPCPKKLGDQSLIALPK